MPDIDVYTTVLPNGLTSTGRFRFSVVLTPALSDSATIPDLFVKWPTTAQPIYTKGNSWSLYFNKAPAVVPATNLEPVSAPLTYSLRPDNDLWHSLIGQHSQTMKVVARTKTNKFKSHWLVSPKAPPLHDRHRTFRAAHAMRQILSRNDGGIQALQTVNDAASEVQPHDIYIYPKIAEAQSGTITVAFRDRDSAKTVFDQINDPKTQKRIEFGQGQLEDDEGEQLTGVALLALYQVCVNSLPGDDPRVKTFSTSINTAFLGLTAVKNLPTGVKPEEFFTAMLHYIQFHIFKNRPQDCPVQKAPTFHQTLGLLAKYPYLMRPLGLIYDFEGVQINTAAISAPGVATSNLPTIAIQPPHVDGINWVRMQSVYTDLTNFQMASRKVNDAQGNSAPVHINRCLALSAPHSSFSLITEDTDGTSHKVTQQRQAAARGAEYQTTKPAGSKSGVAAPNPTEGMPSARTAGLGLYHNDRALTLAQLLQSAPDPGNPTGALLYMEDVTLGYRTDIMINQQAPWMSLHLRDSTYQAGNSSLTPDPTETPLEASADEGFITLSATKSAVTQSVDDPDADLQVQLHESILVWTGWSLSVPRPGSQKVENTVNGKPKPSCPTGTLPSLGLTSTHTVKAGTHLPKLRFGNVYSMRLRHVDLAGNSVVPTVDMAGTVITQTEVFSRHEPLRAPQILIESPIDRRSSPGEQSSTMVLRDNSPAISRRLVPPSEPLRLAESYDLIKSKTLPPSAFSAAAGTPYPSYRLMPNGAFPKVEEACKQQWLPKASVCTSVGPTPPVEASDAILLPRGSSPPPIVPYYPDPAANFIRIAPMVLQQDLCTYVPWREDNDAQKDPSFLPAFYPHIYPFQPWPYAVAMRIKVQGVGRDQPLRINLDMLSEYKVGTLPTVPTLTVELPEACTVVLQLSSATTLQQPLQPELLAATRMLALRSGPTPNPPPTDATLPVNMILGLVHAIVALRDHLVSRPSPPPDGRFARVAPRPVPVAEINAAMPQDAAALNSLLADGSIGLSCPQRPLMLVHAVSKPLVRPDFSGDTCGSEFIVKRTLGANAADVRTKFSAHWMSTAKIICTANWTDKIDDPRRRDLVTNSPQPEVAFEYLNEQSKDSSSKGKPSFRDVQAVHRLRDTRARKVTYKLSASPRFSEFYTAGKSSQLDGLRCCTVQVESSVRPPAPSIAYILPAFSWQNKYHHDDRSWERGRAIVLRVYLERPFMVSGDEECLGVVVTAASGKSSLASVSQWGTDPILNNEHPLQSQTMTSDHFVCQEDVQRDCLSFEDEHAAAGDAHAPVLNNRVDVIPFPVEFSPERQLWFCDIPLSPSRTASAFARLALVRWQPHALFGASGEARLSQVVLADFMQVGPDRWVSVKKKNATTYSVCVSGVFRDPAKAVLDSAATTRTISCSVEQRWHRLGKDLGWRPVCVGPTFKYFTLADGDKGKNLSQWEGEVDLPHSTTFYKFRLLLEEHEWLLADSDKSNLTKPTRVPKSRTTYLHYIEL